jgi:nucleotide-binding universal stress UspA family protein
MSTIKTILVPLDGSMAAETALPTAVAIARAYDARIVLVNARPRPELTSDLEQSPEIRDEVLQRAFEQSTDYLAALAEGLHSEGIRVVSISNEGPAVEVILNAVAATHADMIVMTTHGHNSVRRWILGSTTDKLLHRSHAPVLLVRAVPEPVSAESHARQPIGVSTF